MRTALSILLAILALSRSVALSGQQPPFGPLTSEEGAPLQRLSAVPSVEGPDVTPAGGLAAELWLGYSNIFEQDSSTTHVLFMDMERLLTALTVRWGIAEDLEIGGRLTFETTGGGFLDSAVLWYHERLGFGHANRDRFPQGAYGNRLADGGTLTYLDGRPRTLGLDDARVFLKWRAVASRDGRSALGLKSVAWLPAQAHRVGERRAGVALLGLTRLALGSWYVHGMVGASAARASPELERIVRGGSISASFAVERSLGASVAAVVQYHVATPVLRGFRHRELDGVASNVLLGLAGRWGASWTWDVGFQEDMPADTPAIDFTVGIRVGRTWR